MTIEEIKQQIEELERDNKQLRETIIELKGSLQTTERILELIMKFKEKLNK